MLPSDNDRALPFVNDSKEVLKFRGGGAFTFKPGIPLPIPTTLLRDESGTLYYTSSNGITAASPEGAVLWSYSLPTPKGLKYASLGADGTIYAYEAGYSYYDTEGAIFAFSPGGKVKWTYELKDLSTLPLAPFAGDANGNFIVVTEKGIVSLAPGGTVNWTNTDILKVTELTADFKSANIVDILPDKQGNLAVGTREDGLAVLDSQGKLKWKNEAKGSIYLGDTQVYVLSENGVRVFELATGKELTLVPDEIPLSSSLPNDHEGGYYITSDKGISKIDATGNVLWKYEIREVGYRSASRLVSDVDGNIYFNNEGDSVYSLTKDGQERFILFIQNHSGSGTEIQTDSAGTAHILAGSIGLSRISANTQPVRVRLDNQEVLLPAHPVVNNGTTLLPMRKLFEMLGSSVSWEPSTQTVTATKGSTKITITVGSNTAYVNNEAKTLDEPPVILQDSTLVPLRFVAETLGYEVKWKENEQLIQLIGHGQLPSSETAEPKTLFTNNALRFSVVTPDNWQIAKNPKNSWQIINVAKDQYLNVSTFLKSDMRSNAGLCDVQGIIQINLDNIMTNPVYGDGVSLTVNGLNALQFDVTGERNSLKIHYLFTLVEGADQFYILEQGALESKFTEALTIYGDMIKSFRVMDRTPGALKPGSSVQAI